MLNAAARLLVPLALGGILGQAPPGIWLASEWRFQVDREGVGRTARWYAPGFDDSGWKTVNPEVSWSKQGIEDPESAAWYRKVVSIPAAWRNRTVLLELGSVPADVTFFLNGKEHEGFAPGSVDITQFLKPGQDNLFCFRVRGKEQRLCAKRPFSLLALEELPAFGFSRSVPSVGQRVVVRLHGKKNSGRDVRITQPAGKVVSVRTDGNGAFSWCPTRYGRYTFESAPARDDVWVTAQPMSFFIWDASVPRKYVTHALRPRDQSRCTYWRRRGVELLNWVGGEYLSRRKQFGDKAFKTAQDWVDDWSKNLEADTDGIVIDEIYVSKQGCMPELCAAVEQFRRKSGRGFTILPFFSGVEWKATASCTSLRRACVQGMNENYWGDPNLYLKRWSDMRLAGLDRLGGVLSQSPGFYMNERVCGPRTPEDFRKDIMNCRRVAPMMMGLSLFNAYGYREADFMSDDLIESFFLKPVVHLHPRAGKLIAQNIGNEDAPPGVAVEFIRAGGTAKRVELRTLKPFEEAALDVPEGSTKVRLNVPDGMADIYDGKPVDLPDDLDPLQVTSVSAPEFGAVYTDEHGGLTLIVEFSKPVSDISRSAVILEGAVAGRASIKSIRLSNDRKTAFMVFEKLAEDDYSFFLLSGEGGVRDSDGGLLDGSRNGFIEKGPPFKDMDHFAIHFGIRRSSRR